MYKLKIKLIIFVIFLLHICAGFLWMTTDWTKTMERVRAKWNWVWPRARKLSTPNSGILSYIIMKRMASVRAKRNWVWPRARNLSTPIRGMFSYLIIKTIANVKGIVSWNKMMFGRFHCIAGNFLMICCRIYNFENFDFILMVKKYSVRRFVPSPELVLDKFPHGKRFFSPYS
jgi:hypothetical protein